MSARQPKTSVLMPSYNHRTFVEAAVHSVLQDADPELEMVVVDDGSTDGSADILRQIEDPRLRLFCQNNRGAHEAFNRALGEARGELIFLLNSDDLFLPERLSRLRQELASGDVVAAASWLQLIDGQGRAMGVKRGWSNMPPWPPLRGPRLEQLQDPRAALLESNWLATTSNLAFRRQAAEGLQFRPLRYCHDWDFMLQLARQGPIRLVPEALVCYRVHAANTLKEGESHGQGWMRFEILWLLTLHAVPLLARLPGDAKELSHRLWRSLPRFGCPRIVHQLLALRGDGDQASDDFMALLDPHHPQRRHWISALEGVT